MQRFKEVSQEEKAVVERYNTLRDELKSLQKAFEKAGKNLFSAGAKKILDEHPIVKSFGWNQYTPYFNDGDPCTFHCNADGPFIEFTSSESTDEDEYRDEWCVYEYQESSSKKLRDDLTDDQKAEYRAGTAIKKFLSSFDEDQYEALFGDHAQITITRSGISVDEYCHD